jgi:hypothetical protein
MFPIRLLTPQQATGNALAAGFTLHGARHINMKINRIILAVFIASVSCSPVSKEIIRRADQTLMLKPVLIA